MLDLYINIFLCILLLVLIIFWIKNKSEGFNDRIDFVLKNKHIFNPSVPYDDVKKKISWIDPVIHNDIIELYRSNNINTKNMRNIFL